MVSFRALQDSELGTFTSTIFSQGPRGAVGGCSTPGSRVDPWWNPGSFCPSVPSPGPPRIDEGPPLDNDDFHFCSLQTSTNGSSGNAGNTRLNSVGNQYQHRQPQLDSQSSRNSENGCYSSNGSTGSNGSNTSSGGSLGYIDSTRSNAINVTNGPSDHYGLITSSLQQANAARIQQQQLSTTDSNCARVDSSQGSQRRLPPLLSSPAGNSPTQTSAESLNGILSSLSRVKREDEADARGAPTSSTGFGPSLLGSLLSGSRLPTRVQNYGSRRDNNGTHESSPTGPEETELLLGPVKLEYTDDTPEPRDEYSRPVDMKFETQSGQPTHLGGSGVEAAHSSQGGPGIVVAGSPGEVVGVEGMLLSPWAAAGADFLEAHDAKQSAAGLEDAWDTLLLGSSVGVTAAQSLAELKPLPPFTGYTGHLSINGIPGHHYHTIASSAQRPSMQQSSPSPSSNQEYYESSVVSSSTPCPPVSQKQHQQQQQQQQQQLPQSSQQTVDYNIEDLAEIIGSAMADTTVPGSGTGGGGGGGGGNNNGPGSNAASNGPSSEHEPEVSPRDWIDIAEWIDTACSPKAQETSSSSPYSQMYATTTPPNSQQQQQQQQQHGSTLQSLLTHGYSPMLQQRLQASCGETPSSTSPYPPVSPPGRVSTSCSPDQQLHSSFAAPQHPRKRSRPSGGGGGHSPTKKSPGAATTTSLPYGPEAGLMAGKEKPVHRCSICNRGFLNKSNIKVHLRTHTGEKPFRCEVCGKAFRQKAHLIKHQQIHKRIGRD